MKKIKDFIKDNYRWLISYFIIFIVLIAPVPYYIERPGGLIDVSDRIVIENSKKIEGSFNLAYVTTSKANVSTMIISLFIKDWDLIKKEEIKASNETIKETEYRNHILLEEANETAIFLAYQKANKKISIKDSKFYITYIGDLAKTDLKISDEIVSMNGIDIKDRTNILNMVKDINYDDLIDIEVINNNKHYFRTAKLLNYNNNKTLGFLISMICDYEVDPSIKLNFKNSESGPSGGLMMTLAIYNYLIDEDLTKGRNIAGTGTISLDGSVGVIDGVKYKVMGAHKEKADIFFVPSGNYKEAMEVKKEKKYDINIVKVDTLDEAIAYLKNN